MTTPIDDVLEDLVDEYERLESILESLSDAQWRSPSDAAGWTVTDVMIHLAQTEEAVVATTSRPNEPNRLDRGAGTLDDWVDAQVAAERDEPAVVFARWKAARRASVDALRAADPDARYAWAHTPLKPRTLATTRLAEHWAHALDVTVPFDIPLPDTDRLRHVAWLGHSTLPYGFAFHGQEAHPVRAVLIAPEGRESRTGALETGQGGAAFLAQRANVSIVPVALTGTAWNSILPAWRRLKRPCVTLTFGQPYQLPGGLRREAAIEIVMRRIAALLPAQYQGVYAVARSVDQ
ncbi:MAG TPA: maleylpyruvate isomerase family mycothiol-dependent enzyme [Acidimicrobiales bacterium]|nr:maleylpyruvate isomerase family mycothiol-dependent enzyme [Acidimicrobiales bacterium]